MHCTLALRKLQCKECICLCTYNLHDTTSIPVQSRKGDVFAASLCHRTLDITVNKPKSNESPSSAMFVVGAKDFEVTCMYSSPVVVVPTIHIKCVLARSKMQDCKMFPCSTDELAMQWAPDIGICRVTPGDRAAAGD